MSKLFFWQDSPSIHQAPLIRELANRWDDDVLIITEFSFSSNRIKQGWTCPDFSPAKLVAAPNRLERMALFEHIKNEDRSIHIFSGFHAYPESYWTLKQIAKRVEFIGVFVESGNDDQGLLSILRRMRYSVHGVIWGRKLDFLLATGEVGEKWYSRCFFPRHKIYPFGYFVEHVGSTPSVISKKSMFEMLFVGQLVTRKGLDLLFHALSELKHEQWTLRIVGTGAQRIMLEDLAHTLYINDRIQWMGALPNQVAQALMATSDLFILPSRFDGWGAVVNEALMSGTPVAVSNACGASDLINNPSLGYVFEANSVESLRLALQSAIKNGPVSLSSRREICEWADRSIHPAVAAQYLIDIINSVRRGGAKPCVPWRKCE